jgi:hypothetical protein
MSFADRLPYVINSLKPLNLGGLTVIPLSSGSDHFTLENHSRRIRIVCSVGYELTYHRDDFPVPDHLWFCALADLIKHLEKAQLHGANYQLKMNLGSDPEIVELGIYG